MAFVLPVLVLLALAVGQVAVIAQARVAVTHAAREGARVAAVGESDAAIRSAVLASGPLPEARVQVEVARTLSTVRVTVHYREPTDMAIVGALLDDVELVGTAVMHREE